MSREHVHPVSNWLARMEALDVKIVRRVKSDMSKTLCASFIKVELIANSKCLVGSPGCHHIQNEQSNLGKDQHHTGHHADLSSSSWINAEETEVCIYCHEKFNKRIKTVVGLMEQFISVDCTLKQRVVYIKLLLQLLSFLVTKQSRDACMYSKTYKHTPGLYDDVLSGRGTIPDHITYLRNFSG